MSDAQIDFRELRSALGCFATGITVVTAIDQEGRAVGITANSFSSVSLDPPLLLWCVDRRSMTFDTFMNCPHFVISVLNTNAAPIASRFATKGGHYVEGIDTVPTELGPPSFADCLATFECDVYARYDGGDHIIMVGRVRRFTGHTDPDRNGAGPLLYFRGRFGNMTDVTG